MSKANLPDYIFLNDPARERTCGCCKRRWIYLSEECPECRAELSAQDVRHDYRVLCATTDAQQRPDVLKILGEYRLLLREDVHAQLFGKVEPALEPEDPFSIVDAEIPFFGSDVSDRSPTSREGSPA